MLRRLLQASSRFSILPNVQRLNKLRNISSTMRQQSSKSKSVILSVLGGGSLLAAAIALKSPARSLEEKPATGATSGASEGIIDRALSLVGLTSWITWAVEPAERAGCPPGKLLPDPPELPPGVVQRVLVLGLEDCLIHTEWDRVHGHRTKKRPGLDAFLAHVSQFYEVVIFSSAMQSYAGNIVLPLQESGYVHHLLSKENTKYVDGKHVKDLSYLNRDLRHVIILDTNPDSYSHQPSNAVPIKPWQDDLEDTELIDLVPFLEAVFREDVPDVREVIRHFQGFYIPEKFRSLRHQAVERKKRGALLGRARTPGVLPVLSSLVPQRPPTLTAPAVLHAAKAQPSERPSESSEGHGGASEVPSNAAATSTQPAKKNVFQLAKEKGLR